MQWLLTMVEWDIPPWKTLNPQGVDSDNQENYQEENIVSLQHLTCEMEGLRQTVKDRDIDPRDAITNA